MRTDEALDFDLEELVEHEKQCQHSAHKIEHGDARVEYLVQVRCPFCVHFGQTFQCAVAVKHIFALGLGVCNRGCGNRFQLAEFPNAYRVVPV